MTKSTANFLIACCLLLGAVLSVNPSPRGHCTTGQCHLPTPPPPAPPRAPGGAVVPLANWASAAAAETRAAAAGVTAASAAAETSAATASSPRLNLILPRGVQRGQTHTLEFLGERLGDAQEIFFYSPGFHVQSLEKVDGNRVRAVVVVDAEVPPGRHIAQVRTPFGVSDYRPFWVNHWPSIAEVEPNNDLGSAQRIALNVVVDGVVTNEDVDYYAVECEEGQRLSVEMVGMRLGSYLFDPYIAILDADRFELAVSDDSALAAQDGICSVQIPSAGTYYVMVRESSFGGNDQCRYQLHIGDFPRPTAVFPAGGPVGQTLTLQFLGDALGPFSQEVTLPPTASSAYWVQPDSGGGMAASGFQFRLGELPNSMEVEPNNQTATATEIEFPSAVNGIIAEDGDHDYYKFTARQGQVWDIEVYGRRIRSGLDPVMHLLKGDGSYLVGNDDSRGPDPYLRWTVPEDGDYYLWIHDHLNRGRPDFVYRVEFQAVAPSLSIEIPRVEQFGQYRQAITVPRGGRFGTLILGNRNNFGGELVLEADNLPSGISLHAQPMAANLNQMPVVFEATEDAAVAGQLLTLYARHADPNQSIRGHFRNSADFVLGEPNNSKYVTGEVEQVAVAVVERLPFRIDLQQPQSPLVQGGSKDIRIVVHRDEGFTGNIHVEFPFRSPGVGTRGNIQIPPDQTEGLYPLNAAGNAQVGSWPIYAIGMSDVGGPAWSSTQLGTLEIATPYVTMEIPRAGCEQGETVLVPCRINQLTPFEGEATAQLFGLPPHCEAETLTFNAATEEIVFRIKTTAETNAGKHRGVFCQVTIPVNGESVVSQAGSFELQVDVPLPKETPPAETPVETPVETPPPAAEAPPAEKPLSRLEKLRLDAKKNKSSP